MTTTTMQQGQNQNGAGNGAGAAQGSAQGSAQGAAGAAGEGAVSGEELGQIISRQVAGAVSGYFKRGTIKEQIAAAVADVLPGVLTDALQAAGVAPAAGSAPTAQAGAPAPAASGQANIDDHPTIKQLKAQNEQLQKQLRQQQDAVTSERTKAQQQEERAALTETLRAAGVPDNRIRGAIAELYLDQKRVVRDDKGGIAFTMERDWGTENVPLAKGVAEWLATDEGKAYLPPVDARGSGGTGGGRPRPPGQKPNRQELLQTLGRMMMGHR